MLTSAVSDCGVTVDDVRADRLVSLALLLQARGRMSAHELAGELEVSVRTIYRDISALNAAGIPVMAEPGPGGGCRLIEGYRFPLRGLSADEAEALLLLGVPAAVAELGLADALAAAHRKVSTSAGLSAGGSARQRAARAAGGRGTRSSTWTCPAGFTAPSRFRTCARWPRRSAWGAPAARLPPRRASGHGEKTREVGPLGLVNKAGTWYLVATRAPATGGEQGRRGHGRRPARSSGSGGSRRLACWPPRPAAGRLRPRRLLGALVGGVRDQPLAGRGAGAGHGDGARRSSPTSSATRAGAPPRRRGPPARTACREVVLTFEEERVAAHRLAGFGGEVAVISPAAVRAELIATARELLARYGEFGTGS